MSIENLINLFVEGVLLVGVGGAIVTVASIIYEDLKLHQRHAS